MFLKLITRRSSSKRVLKNALIKDMLRYWTKRFEINGISEPEVSAEYILAHVLKVKTLNQVHCSEDLSLMQRNEVNRLCRMRMTRCPIQYVVGEWDFRDIVVKLRPPVLIPRPETEELAQLCIQSLGDSGKDVGTFLEIGVGSGALTVSVLKTFHKLRAVAVDISATACNLTHENAVSHGVRERLNVIEGDITDSAVSDMLLSSGPYDLIISNPPYVTTDEMMRLQPEIALYEDLRALHGGADGLDLIREIISLSDSLLAPEGHLWLEVGQDHPTKLEKFVAETQDNLIYLETVKDIFGRNRFCHMTTPR